MTDKPLGIPEIMRHLPHRYPFLMIDKVLRHGGNEVLAVKNVSVNEPYFIGHFPSEPIMPGVLVGESMSQAAAFLGYGDIAAGNDGLGEKAFLTNIHLKLERPVVPGDQLLITARLVKRFGKLMRVSARVTVDNVMVASAEITVAMV